MREPTDYWTCAPARGAPSRRRKVSNGESDPVLNTRTSSMPGNRPERDSQRDQRGNLAVWITFAAILAVCAVIRLADQTGWLGSDDAAYFSAAEQVLGGETQTRVHHHIARLAVVAPIVVSLKLMGHTTAAVMAPTLIASLLCIGLVVMLGKTIFGWWEGLMAGTVFAFLPYYHAVSTVAYPDVHACLWSTLAVFTTVLALRSNNSARTMLYAIICGLAIGMAMSAKLFSIGVILAIGYALLRNSEKTPRERIVYLAYVVLAGSVFFVAHGLYYVWTANDFWYKLSAIRSMQGETTYFPVQGYYDAASLSELIINRLGLLFDPRESGWGIVGIVFWPVMVISFFKGSHGRMLSIWATATYLIAAFVPSGAGSHYQPPPIFDGRNILLAGMPFAICFAQLLRQVLSSSIGESQLNKIRPVVLAAIIALAFYHPHELHGFRKRHTQRVAEAVGQAVAETQWDSHRLIFMSAPMYIRYRILFPPQLRDRLRIAVDSESPDWWRGACLNVEDRHEALPQPGSAYLLATPKQLAGTGEAWDYDVLLPRVPLKAWRESRQPFVQSPVSSSSLNALSSADITDPIVHVLDIRSIRKVKTKTDQHTESPKDERSSETG